MPSPKISPPAPPEVLRGVTRAVLRALGASDALRSTRAIHNTDGGLGPVIALGALESYFEAAKRQQHRIERAKTALLNRTTARTRPLFDEVHFYLICWARVAKLARFIAHATRFRRTGLVLRRYRSDLEERIDARDHLEHFEERLPGGSRRDRLAIPGDLLNMHGDSLTYGGQKIDIGPKSVRLLRSMVTEFRTAVLFDSFETLAAADPNRAVALLRRAGSAVKLARVTKQMGGLVASPRKNGTTTAKQRLAADAAGPRR